jgi:uncharacterized membrane protein YfcA
MLLYIILGLVVGVLSGILGIGGGVVIIPALVFLFGFNQHQAQGTSLALFSLPIAILAANTYYKQGYIDIKIVSLLALGFVFGGLIGSKIGINLPDAVLTKIFGIGLLLISLKMIFAR